MALFVSAAARWMTSTKETHGTVEESQHARHGAIPLISSPVDPDAIAWLRRKRRTTTGDDPVPGQVRRSFTVAQFEAEHDKESKLAGRIFRKQHAASTLELFFDLFFVANLAVFTANHEHVSLNTLANYVGFFAILWSTWFHISIYDVRFYADSIYSRICKMINFAVMVSFVGLGSVYDVLSGGGTTRAFHGIALVLMGLRFLLCVQYLVVLYFVSGFQKTLIPLFAMSATYLLSGCAFLVTYVTDDQFNLDERHGAQHVNYWYIIIGLETLVVIIISSVWRVLSFKHTHLVERVGLLTLIVIGEGIIGLTKSISYAVSGTDVIIWAEVGLVSGAVMLIYLTYLLYFDSVNHDRFGSIRQQIWTLCHFALHVTILLTVEGQSALVTWDACRSGMKWFDQGFPSVVNPANGYDSTAALVSAVNSTLIDTAQRYHYKKLSAYYDYSKDLMALQNTSKLEFASSEWNQTSSGILQIIQTNVEYFMFTNFNAEGPKEIEDTKDPAEKVLLLYGGFKIVFEYFFIGAGCLLIVLAIMTAFGTTKKKGDEWASIVFRLCVGLALPCVSAIAFLEKPDQMTGYRFDHSGWIIPIVTFSFLLVLVGDNVICTIFQVGKNRDRRKSYASTINDHDSDDDDGDMAHGGPLRSITMKKISNVKQRRFRRLSNESERDLTRNAAPPASSNHGYAHVDQHDPSSLHDEESRLGDPDIRR